jgi:Na+-driven multidrug efflux pump
MIRFRSDSLQPGRIAGAVVSEALALSTVICVMITTVLLVATPDILRAIAPLPPDMVATASEYIRVRAIGLPFALGYSVMQAYAPLRLIAC